MKSVSLSPAEKQLTFCKFVTPIIAVLCAIFGAMAFYTADGRYFNNPIWSVAFYASLTAGVLLTLIAPLITNGGAVAAASESPASKIISKVPAIALLGVIIGAAVKMQAQSSSLIDVATLILAFASVIYYVLVGIEGCRKLSLYMGYLHCMFCLIVVLSLYRDLTIELNAPFKLILQSAFTLGLFSTLSDLRRTHTICSMRQFLFAKLGYVILAFPCGAYTVGCLMAEQYEYSIDYVILPLFLFASGLYALAQLVSVGIAATPNAEEEEPREAECPTPSSEDKSTGTDAE
jgi:hypothetical protein